MPLDPSITLQPHQAEAVDRAVAANEEGKPLRSMLLWQPGAGKSLGMIASGDALGQPYSVLGPASLRTNFSKEHKRFTGPDSPTAKYLSYSQVGRGHEIPHPDTVFADEAQRLTGTGTEAVAARDALMNARNIVLASGTPIRNDASEFGPLLGLLRGKPMTKEQFADHYLGEKRTYPGGLVGRLTGSKPIVEQVLKNQDELRKELEGRVSYYAPGTPPTPVTHETITSEMRGVQADLYRGVIGKLPPLLRLKLRYNMGLTHDELRKAYSFLTGPRQVSLSDYAFHPDNDPYRSFQRSGKLTDAFAEAQKTLASHPAARVIAYSNFVNSGLVPYAAGLEKAGVPYRFFHGGLSPAERQKSVDDFNNGRVRMALVGPAGAEGISLRGAQTMQLLDPYWNNAKTQQAAARGLRFDSHEGLPPELQRMNVQTFRSRLAPGPIGRLMRLMGVETEPTPAADDYLTNLSGRKSTAMEPLLELLRDVGTHRSVPKIAEVVDTPVSPVQVPELVQAKQYSDNRQYLAKAYALRGLIQRAPHEWLIDTPPDRGVVGLTHIPTKFKVHLPLKAVSDLLPGMSTT